MNEVTLHFDKIDHYSWTNTSWSWRLFSKHYWPKMFGNGINSVSNDKCGLFESNILWRAYWREMWTCFMTGTIGHKLALFVPSLGTWYCPDADNKTWNNLTTHNHGGSAGPSRGSLVASQFRRWRSSGRNHPRASLLETHSNERDRANLVHQTEDGSDFVEALARKRLRQVQTSIAFGPIHLSIVRAKGGMTFSDGDESLLCFGHVLNDPWWCFECLSCFYVATDWHPATTRTSLKFPFSNRQVEEKSGL